MLDADAGPAEPDAMTAFLWRNRWLVGVMALIGALGGFFGARLMERIYRADVLTSPTASESASPMRSLLDQFGPLASLAGINVGNEAANTSITIATLKSRVFLENFIDQHHLMPVLFAKRWDAVAGKWHEVPGSPPPTNQDGVAFLLKDVLRVLEEKDKGLVTVRVEWTDPALAAEWANALVADLNSVMRDRAIQLADTTLQYLQRELNNAQGVDLRTSISANIQMQVNRKAMANSRPEYALTVLDPAVVADRRSFVRPIPVLIAAIGLFAGALLAMLIALVLPGRSNRRASGGS